MLVQGGSSLLLILVWTWCGTASGAEASGSDPFAARPQPGQQAVKPDERLLKLDALFQLMQSSMDRTQRMPSPYDDAFLADARVRPARGDAAK